jgi:ubiquinone biosynthesis protein COQ9
MSWYKHRVAVAGLYVAGELSLIQDKSPDFTDTWAFLARRIEELRKIKQCDTKVQASSKQFVDISNAAVTTVR